MSLWLAAAVALLSPAFGAESDDAKDNFETVVRNHVATQSPEGAWVLKDKATGKPLRLTLSGVDRTTVRPVGAGRWSGLADFKPETGRGAYAAEFVVDISGDLWDVKTVRWLSRSDAAAARLADARAAATPSQERKAGQFGLLPDRTLPTLAGQETYLPACTEKKCLTVVVAPWCPHCRDSTAVIVALRDWLPKHGVGMSVVVARDNPENVRDYAKTFGPATMLDPEGTVKVAGVPHFLVTTDGGAIVGERAGAIDEKDPERFAAWLGLP